jgi:hypothetical protein
MRRFEWNALRPGDHVAVHDDRERDFDLVEGDVVIVQTEHGLNDIAIRVTHGPSTESETLRPRRSAVHLLPVDEHECWRCAIRSAA